MLDSAFAIAQGLPTVAKARVCAMLEDEDGIIDIGVNQYKSHPLQARFGSNDKAIFLHSEIDAIINQLRRLPVNYLKYSTLWIARAKKINGVWKKGLAKPCSGCQRAIIHFNIKEVHWTIDDLA